MAILEFKKPKEVQQISSVEPSLKGFAYEKEERFEFYPLEPGYGTTMGNALRRVLLSSLEGFAITALRVEGVNHEFASIPGITEDFTQIILNLKKIRFRQKVDYANHAELKYKFPENKTEFRAGDLNEISGDFEVMNPDELICVFDPKKTKGLEMDLTIDKGRGYLSAEENKKIFHADGDVYVIPIDSIFSPIRKVSYKVKNEITNYEKLTLDIVTDGTIEPSIALTSAAEILMSHFSLLTGETKNIKSVEISEKVEVLDVKTVEVQSLLKTSISDVNFNQRALNCMKNNNIETLADLVSLKRSDLIKIPNLGKKSIEEIEKLLEEKNLHFGMDVESYNI